MLATTPQRDSLAAPSGGAGLEPAPRSGDDAGVGGKPDLSALPGSVRRGWVPDPVRVLPLSGALAELWKGGVPRGRVSEVVGPLGAGRTSLVLSLLSAATRAREVAAMVDLPNAFDPASAFRAEVDLGGVLWVRPPSVRAGLRCTEWILGAGGFGLVVLDLDGVSLRRLRLYTWPRLARAAERSGAALVIVAPMRLAGSFAACSIEMHRRRFLWRRAAGAPVLFDGLESGARMVRNKLGPPGPARILHWSLDPVGDLLSASLSSWEKARRKEREAEALHDVSTPFLLVSPHPNPLPEGEGAKQRGGGDQPPTPNP